MNTYHVYIVYMSSALNGSSTLEHFEGSNASKIRNGISTWECHMCHVTLCHDMTICHECCQLFHTIHCTNKVKNMNDYKVL